MLVYVTKFFWWEAGYWNTMDIAHDRGPHMLYLSIFVPLFGLNSLWMLACPTFSVNLEQMRRFQGDTCLHFWIHYDAYLFLFCNFISFIQYYDKAISSLPERCHSYVLVGAYISLLAHVLWLNAFKDNWLYSNGFHWIMVSSFFTWFNSCFISLSYFLFGSGILYLLGLLGLGSIYLYISWHVLG